MTFAAVQKVGICTSVEVQFVMSCGGVWALEDEFSLQNCHVPLP